MLHKRKTNRLSKPGRKKSLSQFLSHQFTGKKTVLAYFLAGNFLVLSQAWLKKWQKLPRRRKAGGILVVIGVMLIGLSIVLKQVLGQDLSFKAQDLPNQIRGEVPIKIAIPQVKLQLPVEETAIVNGQWEVAENGASHLVSSAGINGGGNIVIYGHNKNSALGPIRWLSLGDEIRLTGKDGGERTYLVTRMATIAPSDIHFVLPTDKEQLTVYTCTGFWDKDRFVVIAEPQSEL